MTEIPFNKPSLVGAEIEYILEAIRIGQLSGDGVFTKRCNAIIEHMTGTDCALLTHSCTAALEMAAFLCNLQPGDEVIVPSYTFVSTANAIVLRGATPVFVDIDQNTLNMCPLATSRAVTGKTKAIFAVHYAGFPCDMDALADIAARHDLILVEDAAQALGSTYKGRPAGKLGHLGAFSFHETKNIISGEGGALTINRPDLVERAEIIREKGTNRSRFVRGAVDKYSWVDVGSSYLPGELIASFLLAQLERADEILARRRSIVARYTEALAPLEAAGAARLPAPQTDAISNGHMFYLLLPNPVARTEFIAYMKSKGLVTPFHYVPLHSAPAGVLYGRVSGDMSVTNDIAARLVRLPVYFELRDDIELVISAVLEYFSATLRTQKVG